jgi:predicted nucleotidyltransferase
MKYGLTDSEFKFLNETVIQPLKNHQAKVFIFGSRANGKFKKFSDIDLLYIENTTHQVPLSTITKINMTLDESDFPYKVDLVNYAELAASYRSNVDKDKIEI